MSACLRSASSALEMLRPMQGHSAPPATSTSHQLVAQPRKARLSFRKRPTDVEKGAHHDLRFATTTEPPRGRRTTPHGQTHNPPGAGAKPPWSGRKLISCSSSAGSMARWFISELGTYSYLHKAGVWLIHHHDHRSHLGTDLPKEIPPSSC